MQRIMPFLFLCKQIFNVMNNQLSAVSAKHVTDDQVLERSRWYGPNLFTMLATAEETRGAFSLTKVTLRKGFEPPRHVHSREEESYFILAGEIIYEAGEQRIHAKTGDYVHLPRLIPHQFTLISDTVTLLLIITPGGFENMFVQCSRPALSMELPPVPTAAPGKDFFEKVNSVSAALGVTTLPDL
jgi:quercetin dioxygenase-like cupin family protein